MRSSNKYIFKPFMALAAEKDHDIIKCCDTIKLTKDFVFREI